MLTLPPEVRRPLERLGGQIQTAIDRWLPGRRHHADDRSENGTALDRRLFGGPVLDVEETDDTVIVRAELPGLHPDDFTVDAIGDRLVIRGEKGEEREERGRGFHRMECRYGSFVRSVALPCDVDPDRATARYRDGVLVTILPKTELSKARRIRVDVRST